MKKASSLMYTIANIFTWLLVIDCIVMIVLSILSKTNAINAANLKGRETQLIFAFIYLLVVSLLSIVLVRIAKEKNSSKFWHILFLILGIFGVNIFYLLGGIFGLVADDEE